MTLTLGIIGAGAVAHALVAALTRSGAPEYRLLVWARRPEPAASVARWGRGRAVAVDSIAELQGCDVILVAVSDAALQQVSEQLAAAFDGDLAERPAGPRAILHTGGARTGEDALAALASVSPGLGSLHPLVAVAGDAAPAPGLFLGMPFAVEASTGEATDLARQIVGAMGGFEVELPGAETSAAVRLQKLRYHALATMVATGVVTLVDRAAAAMAAADPGDPGARDRFRRAYGELARSAVTNIMRDHGASVLTGAIARGDTDLVERHLTALDGTVNADLYRAVESAARRMLNDRRAGGPKPGGTDPS